MKDGIMRASAREGEMRPSEFGDLARAIDGAEGIAWDRIGGPTDEDHEQLNALERRLANLRAETVEDCRWLFARLTRAVENGWSREDVRALLKLAG